jgi:aromatic-L-amino-acid decarboxylase
MTPGEFRQWGYRFVDWVANYLEHSRDFPVLSAAKPGEIREQLPASAPSAGESMEQVLHDLDRIIVPGLTHWNHPSFFAYFPITGSEPGILGEMVAAALNVNGMLWKTSPSATELEDLVMDWLRDMLGLPRDFKGMIFDTASMSTFHALAAARECIPECSVRDAGIAGNGIPRLRIYASEQAHSSVEKSAMALGLGRQGLIKIPTDQEFRMDVNALETAIENDLRKGYRPIAVVGTVGTTSTTSIDPIARIAAVCRKHALWLHVDAAYGGCAAIVPEYRHILDGCEMADSFVTNPHKWLLTPMDLSAFYCRRYDMLRRAFSLTPEYLRTTDKESVTNPMDYTLQLGRRFRSLKLWFVLRHYGVVGLQTIIREHIRLAKLFASLVESDARFELLAPVPFSTVCFRLRAGDTETQRMINRVNASGRIFISHTNLNQRLTARFSIGNARSREEHVREAWQIIAAV